MKKEIIEFEISVAVEYENLNSKKEAIQAFKDDLLNSIVIKEITLPKIIRYNATPVKCKMIKNANKG